MSKILNELEINRLRENAKVHKIVFEEIKKIARPGVSAYDIDKMCGDICKKFGVLPGFKGVYDFPANLCISINNVVVHGVPKKKDIFKEGDFVTFDFGVKDKKMGLNTDAALTIIIGEKKHPELEKFLRISKEALMKGVAKAIPGNKVGDISYAIQTHVEKNGYHIVRELTGHGIGYTLHEKPYIYNFGKPGTGPILKNGMCLCIEPIIGYSTSKITEKDGDWSIYMADGGIGSQVEHQIIVKEGYPEIIV